MTVNCFQISDGPTLTPCDYSFAIDAIRQKTARIWIDLQDIGTNELEEKLDDLKVEGLIRRICLESRDHPGFYPIQPIGMMTLPARMEIQDVNILEYVTLLFNQDFLISVRNSKTDHDQKNSTTPESVELLPDDTISGIISSMMVALSLDSLRKVAKLGDRILSLEKQMDHKPDSVDIDDISDIRSQLLTFKSTAQGPLLIVEDINQLNIPIDISESAREYFKWATANLNSLDKKLDWLEHRIEIMHASLDSYGQDNMNRRLGRLTVLSMIFMPITFLAGIWGMNFDYMPGLHMRFGSAIALGAMILIAGGMYFYFERRGWFK